MEKLNEKLDYNFSWQDVITIDGLMQDYISDREEMYTELFLSTESFSIEDVNSYIKYFCGEPSGNIEQDEDFHENLYHIKHFLNRNYEINLVPDYQQCVNTIVSYFYGEDLQSEDEIEDFIKYEEEQICNLKKDWCDFLCKLEDFPMLNLDKMKYSSVAGVQVYYNEKIDPWVLKTFLKFVSNVKMEFPNTLLRMDTFVLVSKEYIEFCGGEGTEAFYTDEAIFYADSCEEDDHKFYETCLYHEFGHFIFSLLSETYQIYWEDCYKEWKNSKLKMTRDEEKNSQLDEFCEELFADTTACHYLGNELNNEDYIHNPSKIISDSWEFVIKNEFK